MPPLRAVGLTVGTALVLAALVAVSPSASAAGEELEIPDRFQDVVEGDSVQINVTFGVNDDEERVSVGCGDPCPIWDRTVVFDEQKANCRITDSGVDESGAEEARRECTVSFPRGFGQADGDGPSARRSGQPAHPRTYDVALGQFREEAHATFDAHLSSASTCRALSGDDPSGVAQRSDVVLLSTSGHASGQAVTIEVRDGQRVFFQREFTSQGRQIAYHFRWRVPIGLSLDGDQREVEILVDAGGSSERESILVRPGEAHPIAVRQPGVGDQDEEWNRTQEVQAWVTYRFLSAPPDCTDVSPTRRLVTVTDALYGEDPPTAEIRRINDPPNPRATEVVDTRDSVVRASDDTLLFNYTIPKDERVTDDSQDDPEYDVRVPRTELSDGNFIDSWNSTNYEVYPYDIEPEFQVLQDEVERLETARLVMNLTYADGSPFTPNETDGQLEVDFGPEGEDPVFEFEANHREEGVWNVSQPLGFEYEPLGAYTWRIQELRDDHGDPGEENRVPETVTDLVDVVSARPRLNLTTLVDGERVNGSERTQRVNVRLDARFSNGDPLTADQIDPSLGGVVLNVDKRNRFGRVVDQDRLVMTSAGRPGAWIQSFRVGRSPSVAPEGTWDLEIVARDDRDPPNENVSQFPFRVRPANVTVSTAKSPPPLVNGSKVPFRFRLHYPDGSLVSERLLDESRGGRLDVTLERVSAPGEPAAVERRVDPRPISGGQAWRVELNASKIVPGNHFFNVSGQDIHGNPVGPRASDLFTVLFNGEFRNSTTPVCPAAEGTEPSSCEVGRGETVYVVFPGADGDQGMLTDEPEIRIHRRDPDSDRWLLFRQDVRLSPERFFNLTGRDVGNNHVGRFTTERSTPTGTYRLAILGRTQDGRGFAGFSQSFNVTRVSVNRDVVSPFPDAVKKTQEISARIESEAGDVIDTAVAEAGPVRIRNLEVDSTGVGTFVRWRPPSTLPTGPASVLLQGRDLFGNPFEVTLGPVQLEPVEIEVDPRGPIPDSARRGEVFAFDARLTYETGAQFTEADGSPSVVVFDEDGDQVDTGVALERVDDWEIRWTPPADLPPGRYTLEVTGTDDAGNVVRGFSTPPIQVTSGTIQGTVAQSPPNNVERGSVVGARFTFPTQIVGGNATVTTGSDVIGEPETRINGSTVDVRFATQRSTELVDAQFRFTGDDAVGNNVSAETDRFTVRPQRIQVRWVEQPPPEVTTQQSVRGAFVAEYPDGTLMRPNQGTPIVGLFAVDDPLGSLDATPLEQNPAVWTVDWEPPDDVRTDVPYHFSASVRDRFENEGPPVASQGFFVQDPVVPDYVSTPGPGPGLTLAALAAIAAALGRRRVH